MSLTLSRGTAASRAGWAISDSSLFPAPLPQNVVASAFANRELYLVLANYGHSGVEVETTDAYVPVTDPSIAATKKWKLAARSLQIGRRSG